MLKNTLILVSVLLMTISFSFAQKLKFDKWEVSIDKWAKSEKGLFGETLIVYEGVVNIKRSGKNMKSHLFSYTENDGKFIVKDASKKVKEPQMKFDAKTESFSYQESTGEEVIEKALEPVKPKQIVLSGIIIWLNYKE